MWHAWSWPLIEERPQRSLALSRIFLFMAAFSSSHVEAWLHVHCPGLEKKWRRPNNNFKPCTRLVTGSTGATTNEDIPLSSYSTANCNEGPNYIVNFIQLATSAQQPATHCFKPVTPQIQQFIPKCGYALKIGGAERTVFTQQQKEIMIQYYNRQANYDIQADTTECAATMRKRGLEPLKDSQIKSWWNSYHQKSEREMERMAQHLHTAREGTTAMLSNQPASTTQPTICIWSISFTSYVIVTTISTLQQNYVWYLCVTFFVRRFIVLRWPGLCRVPDDHASCIYFCKNVFTEILARQLN